MFEKKCYVDLTIGSDGAKFSKCYYFLTHFLKSGLLKFFNYK